VIAGIAVIADIARNRKGKTLPLINADERGSGNRKTFTTEDTKEHRGTLEIEQNLFTAKDAKGAEEHRT
jgi:hypothetical protein